MTVSSYFFEMKLLLSLDFSFSMVNGKFKFTNLALFIELRKVLPGSGFMNMVFVRMKHLQQSR